MPKLTKKRKVQEDLFLEKENLVLDEAVELIKKAASAKFDETVEVAVNLGIDPRHADQVVRGVCALPHGSGKTIRVAVFARGDKATEATIAGADIVGAEDLMETILKGNIEFDRCIASPDMMPIVGRLGKVLGPRNLMPNPKVGTVTPDLASAVKAAKSGEIQFKAEKAGVVQVGIGKISFDKKKLVENFQAFINELKKSSDYLFTTGGIGPTHDDITSKSISKALKLPFEKNIDAWKRLEKHYLDEEFTKARQKMAYMPKGSELIDNPVSVAPGFMIENIYVFPGVPKILEVMIDEFFKKIDSEVLFYKKTISTVLSEGIIGSYLSDIQKKYKDLEIGSYPYFKKNSFGVSIVFVGDNEELINISSLEVFEYLKIKNGKPQLF